MNNLNTAKLLVSLSLVVFGAVACAAETEDGSADDQSAEGEEVGTSEDALSGGCKSRAVFLAQANRKCGPSNHVIEWNKGVRRYRSGGEWKTCAPNFFISVPYHCR